MNIFDSVGKFLNEAIDNYKAEAKRVHVVAEDGGALAPYELDRLIVANARANAAMNVQTIISQTVAYSKQEGKETETALMEALPRTIRAIQNHMDIALRNEATHIATIRTYNEVLSALRAAEVDGITLH
jgi:hypothetical protein